MEPLPRRKQGAGAWRQAYADGMAMTEPVEIDRALLGRVRDVAGTADVRSFVEAAVRHELDHHAFGKLLDELEAEGGPVPDDLVAEAERVWHGS